MNTMGTNVVNEIVLHHILCILLFFQYRQPFHWYIHNQRVLDRMTALPFGGGWGGVVKRATLREKTRKQQCVFIDIYISNILYKHICAEPRPVGAGRSSRTEVRLLPASVPLALEYPDIGHAESGVAQGVAHRVDGAVDVA